MLLRRPSLGVGSQIRAYILTKSTDLTHLAGQGAPRPVALTGIVKLSSYESYVDSRAGVCA